MGSDDQQLVELRRARSYANCYNEGPNTGMCQFAEGWWCKINGAGCNRPFTYSGGGLLTVEVIPNCDGTSDTIWSFEIACPD